MRLHESKLICVLCTAVCMATKKNMKHKELPVSVELGIIKKVVLNHTEVGNELSIPISTLNNIMAGKRNIL